MWGRTNSSRCPILAPCQSREEMPLAKAPGCAGTVSSAHFPPPCTLPLPSLSAHLQGRALSTPLPTQHCTNMSAAPCSEVGPEMWGGDGMCSNSSNHTWVCSKEFMLRYRGPANCWIGLHRAEGAEHWTWADGSTFSNWSVCASVCRGGISYGVCLGWGFPFSSLLCSGLSCEAEANVRT